MFCNNWERRMSSKNRKKYNAKIYPSFRNFDFILIFGQVLFPLGGWFHHESLWFWYCIQLHSNRRKQNLKDLEISPPLGSFSFMNIYSIDSANSFILKRQVILMLFLVGGQSAWTLVTADVSAPPVAPRRGGNNFSNILASLISHMAECSQKCMHVCVYVHTYIQNRLACIHKVKMSLSAPCGDSRLLGGRTFLLQPVNIYSSRNTTRYLRGHR